jgi:uncharacterized membrane protein YbhN (UPF0104 family)
MVAGGTLVFAARGVDRGALADALAGVDVRWLAAAAVANVLNIVMHGWAWQIGLGAGGAGPVAIRHALTATWAGKAVNQLLPGKVGELVRIAMIRSHLEPDRREISRVVGSVVAQRALNLVATLAIVTITASLMPLPVSVPGGRWTPVAALLMVAAVAAGVRLAGRSTSPTRVGRGRVRTALATFAGGAGLLRPSRASARAVSLHMVAVSAQLVTFACLLRGFDIATPLSAPLLIIALVGLAGAVPGAPGGLGLNQAALVAPLGAAYGVEPASALAFALGLQATVAVVAVAGGLVAVAHHRRACALRPAVAPT